MWNILEAPWKIAEYIRMIITDASADEIRSEMDMKRALISHCSADRDYCSIIIDLLRDCGVKDSDIVCTSVEGYNIPYGSSIYDFLRECFIDDAEDLFVIFMLSSRYYKSNPCVCEVGAHWIMQNEYRMVLLPGFDYSDIEKPLDMSTIAMKLDSEEGELRQKAYELGDSVRSFFGIEIPAGTLYQKPVDRFVTAIDCQKKSLTYDEKEICQKNSVIYYLW